MLEIDLTKNLPNAPAHYNGAPGQDYLVARSEPNTGATRLDLIRWGLIPSWAKDRKIAWKMINARGETVGAAAAFKTAFARRRCLVPVDGFYEWRKVGAEKRPYWIGLSSREAFTLAGLWENWRDPDTGEWLRTFTIVTTMANALVATLHDRMPVIIASEDRERWLNGPDPSALLKPYAAAAMTMWPVSPRLNSVKNDTPDLLDPIDERPDSSGEAVTRVNEAALDEPANSE